MKISMLFNTNANKVSPKISNMAKEYGSLGRQVKVGDKEFSKFFKSVKKHDNSFSNLTKDANRAGKSINGLTGSLSKFINLGTISSYVVGKSIGDSIQASIDMIETTHLFSVSMGMLAEETDRAVTELNRYTGLDRTNIQSTIGTYNLLARSMGISAENSHILSTNTQKLALDLSSLTNVPLTQVMQDLRSGLVGQSETVYKYGIDVTEASLKQEALIQGITKSVRNMSQGEKVALRYAVMIRQTGLSHGDFAQTINTPANQLKIMTERVATLSRSFGSLFIPTLDIVLPYLNAFLTALNNIIQALALLVGYTAPVAENIDSAFGGIEDGAEDTADAIGGIGKALKELDTSMNFDELNTIAKPTDSSGGGGGVDGVGTYDLQLKGYDNLMNTVKQKSDELVSKIQPMLEDILKIIGLIGVGFLSWKISNVVLGLLTNPMLGKGLVGILKTLTNITGLGIAGIVAVMILRLVDLYKNSESFRLGLTVLNDTAKSVFEGIANFISGLLSVFGDLTVAGGDVAIVLGVLALSLVAPALATALAIFEGISLAIRAIGYASSPAVEQIDVLGEGISEATRTKVAPFLDKVNELSDTLTGLAYTGEIISQDIVDDVMAKTKAISETILDELSSDRNEDLANLGTLKASMGDEAYKSLLASTEKFYSDTHATIRNNENRINEILANAKADNRKLTEDENAELLRLQSEMESTGIKQLSQTQIEYETIMRNLKDNSVAISVEQASEILKKAKETKDGTIADAETQYSTILLSAQRMYESGAINADQYGAMVTSARDARDKTIKSANEQYDGILATTKTKLGETFKFINETTGEIKTKWKVFTEDLKKGWDTFWINMKVSFNRNKEELFEIGKQMFDNMLNGIKSVWTNISNYIKDKVDWLKDKLQFWKDSNDEMDKGSTSNRSAGGIGNISTTNTKNSDMANPKVKAEVGAISNSTGYDLGTAYNIWRNQQPELARGGSLSMGQFFQAGEMGKAELIGSHSGRTTVMPLENSGFVEAMYQAVYNAVMSAQDGNGGQVIENILNLDGETIYRNQQKVGSRRGVNFGMGVFSR